MGVVGSGIASILESQAGSFSAEHGFEIAIRHVCVRDTSKPRDVSLPNGVLTDNAADVVDNPDVQIVIEVMGGLDPAREYCLRALTAGKDVITANKALLAEHGNELFRTAFEHNAGLAFEASVCGGIPIIRALAQGLSANRIDSLYGILNGTTNYILTKMSAEGGSFDDMLNQAQDLGFAEADPTMDIDGTDAAQKLAILCRLAFGVDLPYREMLKEGISELTPLDIDYARQLGYTIKLLGIANAADAEVEARVHPVLIPNQALLANINDEFNAVEVVGHAAGPQVYYGRGAGSLPTASAVVSDLIDQADRRVAGRQRVSRHLVEVDHASPVPHERIRTSYYCRFTVCDKPGVLADIARIFSDQTISIATVIQQGRSKVEGGTVPLIMTTHEAVEADMQKAIALIRQLPAVSEPPQVIRIEALR